MNRWPNKYLFDTGVVRQPGPKNPTCSFDEIVGRRQWKELVNVVKAINAAGNVDRSSEELGLVLQGH
jgi:hypothetical protein